jgi:GntR family transcriptional repressor for pyruvate dehydrogenase complex
MPADDSQPLFQTVQREPTLASQVTEQLEALITNSHLQPGDKLPSERELARQFGVSRTVVREAVRALKAKSLVEVTSGSGMVLRTMTSEAVSQSFMLLLRHGAANVDYTKIAEVRRLLEVEIAGLAAQRRTEEDLHRLQATMHELDSAQHDRDEFARMDVAFHTALASATHNELFVIMLESLGEVMLEVRRTGFDAPGSFTHAVEYHYRIYEQVRDQNVAEARHAMSEHLDISEQIFRVGLARQQTTSG